MPRQRTISCVMNPIELPKRPSDLFITPERPAISVCPPAPKKKKSDPLYHYPYYLDQPSFMKQFYVVKQCILCELELVTHMDDPDCDDCGAPLSTLPKINLVDMLPVFE